MYAADTPKLAGGILVVVIIVMVVVVVVVAGSATERERAEDDRGRGGEGRWKVDKGGADWLVGINCSLVDGSGVAGCGAMRANEDGRIRRRAVCLWLYRHVSDIDRPPEPILNRAAMVP